VLRRTRFFCSTWRAFSCSPAPRVQLLPSAAPSRKEPRNALCNANGMCIMFSLSGQAENLSPRGRTEEEQERQVTY
jgi:hypothetical protein